eukprot:gene24273-biopygen22379
MSIASLVQVRPLLLPTFPELCSAALTVLNHCRAQPRRHGCYGRRHWEPGRCCLTLSRTLPAHLCGECAGSVRGAGCCLTLSRTLPAHFPHFPAHFPHTSCTFPHTSRTLVRGVRGECAGSVRQVPAPFTAPHSVQDSLSCMNEQTPPAAESTPGGEDGPPL